MLAALRQLQARCAEPDIVLRLQVFADGSVPSASEIEALRERIQDIASGSAAALPEADAINRTSPGFNPACLAEHAQRRRHNLAKLPEMAFVVHPATGQIVKVHRGQEAPVLTSVPKGVTAAELNLAMDVTLAQARAMLHGLMFGWHAPGADPDFPENQEGPGAPANTAAPR